MLLEKEGFNLYYEIYGESEPVLMIHGAVVDASLYESAAYIMSDRYKVIIYDRRGSSRSIVCGDTTYTLYDQVMDVKDLLDALDITKVSLVGVSAGATVAHKFLMMYPERVNKVILYEPAIPSLLEDEVSSQRSWIEMMKTLISGNKLNTAMVEFVKSTGELDPRAPVKSKDVSFREMGNIYHFLQNELEEFLEYQIDIDKTKELREKIIIAVGEHSDDAPYALAAKKLAKLLGKKEIYYPGYHNFPAELPTEFAICIAGTLMIF